MKTQQVKAVNGSAVIGPGEILELRGEWTSAELIRLQWKLEFMEGG